MHSYPGCEVNPSPSVQQQGGDVYIAIVCSNVQRGEPTLLAGERGTEGERANMRRKRVKKRGNKKQEGQRERQGREREREKREGRKIDDLFQTVASKN